MTWLRIATGVLAAASLLAACGSEAPQDTLVLDWQRGTYEGLRLGDDTSALRRALGAPVRRGAEEPFRPVGQDFYEIGGLTNFASPKLATAANPTTLRYRHRVFATTGRRITAWGTTDPRARTPEGVGIGDAQQDVERHLPPVSPLLHPERRHRVRHLPDLQGARVRRTTPGLRRRPDQEPLARSNDQDRPQTLRRRAMNRAPERAGHHAHIDANLIAVALSRVTPPAGTPRAAMPRG